MAANFSSGHRVGGTARRACCAFTAPRPRATACAAIGCALTVFLLAGCYQPLVLPQSEGHITTPAAKPTLADIPPPTRISSFLPEPKPAVKLPTYTVVVEKVPLPELLFALARDTKQNIDVSPLLPASALVSLNAINETLMGILDRISKQVPIRYQQVGNSIRITPDEPYTKIYQISYVNMVRNSSFTTAANDRIGGGATGAGGTGSSQTSIVTTTVNEFWKTLETDLRGVLLTSLYQSASGKADREKLYAAMYQLQLQNTKGADSAALGAQKPLGGGPEVTPLAGAAAAQAALAAIKLVENVLVNPTAGTVTVSATESQHALVQAYLDRIQATAQRQVLIEATVVEVTLSNQYQAGVDWSKIAVSGAITFNQSMLAGNIGTAPNFAVGYANPNSPLGNIAAAIRLLEQFGNTRVLSSPKIMALNNQTALLKVVDNFVYFNITVTPAVLSTTGAILSPATYTTLPQGVDVGVVMSMTPQISENGQVMLGVRPSITRILNFVNDPNPALAAANVTNPIPQVQTRSMESVLQLTSGQTAILGGLMQENTQYNRDAVPGLGNSVYTGRLSELFGYRNDNVTKSELVIFLRPTVVANPSLESDELKSFQRFLPQQTWMPAAVTSGEKTGATK